MSACLCLSPQNNLIFGGKLIRAGARPVAKEGPHFQIFDGSRVIFEGIVLGEGRMMLINLNTVIPVIINESITMAESKLLKLHYSLGNPRKQ